MQYGTQLAFWEDGIVDLLNEGNIVFEGRFCMKGCPSNGIYQARGTNFTIYVHSFSVGNIAEPVKWLITIQKDTFKHKAEELCHYILDDQWKAFEKIKELTGRIALWRLFRGTEDIHPTFNKEC